MFTAIIRQHQATGHPVTPATLARIRATLRAALNTAIRHGLITANPARHVELPPARRLIPGTTRTRRPSSRRRKRHAHDAAPTRLTAAHPARQITRPRRPGTSPA
jgi:hypothetical protein